MAPLVWWRRRGDNWMRLDQQRGERGGHLWRGNRWGTWEEGAGRGRKGLCSKRRTRQPDSAGATRAAIPASPPPITITFFKNVLFRQTRETRFGDEYKFFRFGEAHTLTEYSEVESLNAREQSAVGMREEPESRAAFRLDEG